MKSDEIRQLVEYHYWARDRLLAAVSEISRDEFLAPRGSSFSSIRDTLAHTYFAEWAWHERWHGNSPSALPGPEQFDDLASLRAAWEALEVKVRGFVESLGDAGLTREIDYRLFSGAEGRSLMWQMLQHVVNHASYHRGQVTTMLRQAGAKPAQSMDLITFYRDSRAKK